MLEIVNGELFLNGIPINLKFIKMSDDTGIEIQDKDGNVLVKINENAPFEFNQRVIFSFFNLPSALNLTRANGTQNTPTQTTGNSIIADINGRGYDGTNYHNIAQVRFRQKTTTISATNSSGQIELRTKNTTDSALQTRAVVDENGRVGIGTETPTERLDVNGNVKAQRFIGIADVCRSPIKQNVDISHTGTTAETIIADYLIPAGTFEANDIFRWRAYFTATNNANVKTVRFYTNTSVSLSGASQLGRRLLTSSAGRSVSRDLVFKNSLSSQETLLVTADIGDDEGATNTALSSRSINFAVDQYFLVTVELANSGDTVTLNWLRGQIFR